MKMKSTILVVDDEKNTREGLRRGLEPLGYKVRLAADASEAIETLKSADIGLMLTDLRMLFITDTCHSTKQYPWMISVTAFFQQTGRNLNTVVSQHTGYLKSKGILSDQ